MDDTDSQKRVYLKTQAGHKVDLDDQGQKVVVTTQGGNQVTLDDGGAKVTVETSGGQSITLQAGSITLSASSVVIKANGVKLGGDAASQSLVLGEALMAVYNLHTHNCTAPGFPSGPPLSPMTPAVLSQIAKTV